MTTAKKPVRKVHISSEKINRALYIMATTYGITTLQANEEVYRGKSMQLYTVYYTADYEDADKLMKIYFRNSDIRMIDFDDLACL